MRPVILNPSTPQPWDAAIILAEVFPVVFMENLALKLPLTR